MEQLKWVGKSIPRVDAAEKVTGQAKYGTDFKLPGLLHARVLRSPHPHARIVSIDTSRAEKLLGVRAIITPEDVPPVPINQFLGDQYALCRDNIVRFVGDPVAAVAADTIDIAEEALDLIEVKYEELAAVFDPEEAFKPNPAVIIHHDHANYERGTLPVRADPERPNVSQTYKLRKGDVEQGFRESDVIIENEYRTSRTQHCSLEGHIVDAWFESDGSLVVRTSDQAPWTRHALYARLCGLSPSKVRVLTPYIGGAFGGKARSRIEPIAILLARKSGKPVRMYQTKEDSFIEGSFHPPVIVHIKDGFKKDGTLVAREVKLVFIFGGYCSSGILYVRRAGPAAAGTYQTLNMKLDAYGLYTNEPPTAALRGFGVPDVAWPIEHQMDIAAETLGINPVTLRKKNLLSEGERNVIGQVTGSHGMAECLDSVAGHIDDWDKKTVKKEEGAWKRGKGIALFSKSVNAGLATVVIVKVWPDGTVEMRHSKAPLGQGINTSLVQIAAEEFGISTDRIRATYGDTALCPYDSATASSRGLTHAGNALITACLDAKEQLFKIAAPKLEASPEDLMTADGKVYVKSAPDRSIDITDLFTRVGTPLQGGEILGRGSYAAESIPDNAETGQTEKAVADYSHIANAVEVEVDTGTGEVRILRVDSAVDVGTAINPKVIEQQVEGQIIMSIGGVLSEDVVLDKGASVNINMTDYRISGILDTPRGANTQTTIVDVYEPEGPFGAKGVGELAMTAIQPAIANAVYDAVGVRIKDLPISKQKVLEGIKKLEKNNAPA